MQFNGLLHLFSLLNIIEKSEKMPTCPCQCALFLATKVDDVCQFGFEVPANYYLKPTTIFVLNKCI